MGAHIWAPEIHFIDGKWYVYFAAGATNDIWKIRPYVLETSAANPLTGTWTEKGRIALPLDTFSLDATTFTVGGTRYLSWAQNDPAVGTGTSIYLAPMSNPWTISGTPARISTPTLSWETVGHRVNEGPAVIQRNGKVFMTFSASATDANYCLGLLTANSTADLMNPASWTKTQTPVFKSNDATGQYGPGHNTFTTSEDGKSDILVYHDRNYKDISGDPLNDPNRRTRVPEAVLERRRHAQPRHPGGRRCHPGPLLLVQLPRPVHPALGVPGEDRAERHQPRGLAVPCRDRAGRYRDRLAGVRELPGVLPSPPEQR